MIKSIDFYFDLISPYSYLAHKKIKILKEKKHINFNYKDQYGYYVTTRYPYIINCNEGHPDSSFSK